MARKAKTLADYRKESATLRKQIADLKKRNGALQYLHEDAERKLRHLKEEHAKTAEALDSTRDELEAMIDARDAADKAQQVTLDTLTQERRERSLLTAERDNLKERLHAREAAYEKADRRADLHNAARQAVLDAVHELGKGLGNQ